MTPTKPDRDVLSDPAVRDFLSDPIVRVLLGDSEYAAWFFANVNLPADQQAPWQPPETRPT